MGFNTSPWDDLSLEELHCHDIVAPHMCLQQCRKVVMTLH